ncbi:hypothetical protein POM88_054966 [Heracleum sosnowskyi]|uniref:SAM-dependent methyltransferase RsmB-F/NOP2-type catalytic core domain-containing protein n=1 Tax=Heracleum sosnowskyi TaxID=360622 RepID=A0AAD8LUE0_9APIA|nr:hypothetical protein POM88_054966 [Heracleum sosnowskyi]
MSANYSPNRSPGSSRLQLGNISRLRSSSVKKPSEPLRCAVADSLSLSHPDNPSEAFRILRDILGTGTISGPLLLLTNGFKLLKVGGYLVYNTCSLTVAQNEDVVEQFLLKNSSTDSLEVELEAKVNKKVQDNMMCYMMLLKKLVEANLGLNLDIVDYCATVPSEDDENATPFTVGTST